MAGPELRPPRCKYGDLSGSLETVLDAGPSSGIFALRAQPYVTFDLSHTHWPSSCISVPTSSAIFIGDLCRIHLVKILTQPPSAGAIAP
jgi:hypothetical protein